MKAMREMVEGKEHEQLRGEGLRWKNLPTVYACVSASLWYHDRLCVTEQGNKKTGKEPRLVDSFLHCPRRIRRQKWLTERKETRGEKNEKSTPSRKTNSNF